MKFDYDLIVIGAGPAGYTACIRASQLKMKVLCIDKRKELGGTCLNVGCIPSKVLLDISSKYSQANNEFPSLGIDCKAKFNISKMMDRKKNIVSGLTQGISALFSKNKVERIIGTAKIKDQYSVEIENDKEVIVKKAKNILIATGSIPSKLPLIDIDEEKIVSSTGALEFKDIPKKLIIVGAGFIGLELGSVWNRLGSDVEVVEYLDRIIPSADSEIAKKFQDILVKEGIKFSFNTMLKSIEKEKNHLNLILENKNDGSILTKKADKVLISTGRKPFTENLFSNNFKLSKDKAGYINVNEKFQTEHDNIYAVGDVKVGPMLAHKAEEEAVAAIEIIAGQAGHVNYSNIPSVVYTHPELAYVGKTEDELKKDNIEYKVGKFPFLANSRARVIGSTDGIVKFLACKDTDRILGVHIIGPEAGTLISEIVVAIEFGASSEDIARICHAHPTLNEAVKEAALSVDKRSINF